MRRLTCLLGLLVTLAIGAAPAYSQTVQGDIQGTVLDAQGNAVPGAKITITNEGTGAVRTLESNGQGSYSAVGFFVGNYRVEVEKAGFQKVVVPGVEVAPVTVRRVDATLQLSTVKQEVTVTGVAPVVQTEGPTIGQTVHNVLLDKPMDDIVRLGVVMSAASYSPGASGGPRGYFMWYGIVASQTELSLEGAKEPGASGDTNLYDNPTACQEITVVAGVPPAEYVRPVIANIQHKSGTNQLHGSYTLDLKNKVWDAVNDAYGQYKHPLGNSLWRHEFNIGGPVVIPKVYNGRNKTFFFFDFWKPRGGFSQATYPHPAPTVAMRAGDYTHYAVKPIDPLTGLRFPGDVIPANRISPVATAIMNTYYPQYTYFGDPNATTNNTTLASYYGYVQKSWVLKMDQNLGTRNVFTFDWKRLIQTTLQNDAA
jgi:hypothetical protein